MEWQHIQYEDGGNPYICTTEEKFKQLQKKYGDRMELIKPGFWIVRED